MNPPKLPRSVRSGPLCFFFLTLLSLHSAFADGILLNCGSASVKNFAALYGVEYRVSETSNKEDISVAELRQELSKHGFTSEALREEGDYLKSLARPAVLHLSRGHFFVVVPAGKGRFLVKDQESPVTLVTLDMLRKEWSGVIIVPAPPTGRTARIPALATREPKIDLGNLRLTEPRDFKVEVNNVGDRSFLLKSVHASCGCLVPQKEPVRVPAGDRAVVSVTFMGLNVAGPLKKEILIETDDPNAPILRFEVNGLVQGPPIALPTVLNFGELAPGHSREKRVDIQAEKYSDKWNCSLTFADQTVYTEYQWKMTKVNTSVIVEFKRAQSAAIRATRQYIPILGKLELSSSQGDETIHVPVVLWRD